MKTVTIGSKEISADSVYLIAEIGINHNGSIETAKQLMKVASDAGFDAVKFQKRTVNVVYSPEELSKPRESVFGKTNGDLKYGLEFGKNEYQDIDLYSKKLGIDWFASPWDLQSVDFLEEFDVVAHKVASASLTDKELLVRLRKTGKPIILSTGMSTLNQISNAVEIIGKRDLILMHTVSTYPAKNIDLNLRTINTLREKFGVLVGYSGHEVGVLPSVIAVSKYNACLLERHITLDRSMWGSDQAASLEPNGMNRLVQYINEAKEVDGDGVKRILDQEIPIQEKLRRVTDF